MPKKDLRPPSVDFDVMQGATIRIDYTISDGAGPVNLTLWSDLRASLMHPSGSPALAFTVNAIDHTLGIGYLLLTAAEASTLSAPESYLWDFWGHNESGSDTCLSRGLISVTRRVLV